MMLSVLALIASFQGSENYAVAILSPVSMSIRATGFLVHDQAVLTAAHAVEALGSTMPVRCGKEVVFGIVTRKSEAVDLAVIEFEGYCDSPVAKIAPSNPATGTAVVAVGYPGGRFLMVTSGVVSAYSIIQSTTVHYALMIDAAIFPGNSGGPVLDEQGRVVAVVTGRVCLSDDDQPSQCYGAATPASLVRIFLNFPG